MRVGHKWRIVWIIAVLCTFLTPHGGFAQVLDPPIGFLEIKDGPEGKITVHARCVRGQDLLDELAKRAGVTLHSERPVQCYVSIYPTSTDARYWSPRKWLQFAAEECGLRFNGEDGKHTATLTQSDYYYDPFLTEDEMVAKYRTSLEPVTPEKGITNGLVILDGHLIRPPYEVAWNRVNEYDAQITVNGLPWFRVTNPKPDPGVPLPDMPASGQFENLDDLCGYVSGTLYPDRLSKNGGDVAKTKQDVVDFIKGQNIAKELRILNLDRWPQFKVGEVLWDIFPVNFDFAAGKSITRVQDRKTLEELVLARLSSVTEALSSGRILMGASNTEPQHMDLSSSESRFALQAMPMVGVLQRECLLKDDLGLMRRDTRIAACNLMDDDYAFMIKNAGRCMDADRR